MAGAVLPDNNGGLTGAVLVRYARLIADAKAVVADAKKKQKDIEKRATDDGVDLKDLDEVMKISAGDPVKYIERINRRTKYLEWLRAPVASAIPRIPDYDPDMVDMTEEERMRHWRDSGFRAGVSAANRDTCPHDHDSVAGSEWLAGWEEGQLKNLSGITAPTKTRGRPKKAPTPPPPAEEPEAEEGGDEDEPVVDDEENDRRWEEGSGEDE